jgi:Zn-dependent protease
VYQPSPFRQPPAAPYRKPSGNPARDIAGYVNWQIVAVFVVLLGFFSVVLWLGDPRWRVPGTVGLVIVGWVFSLCLHEFAHAATAYLGGDHSASTASYLTFNPLKYVNPLLSILMPIVFILLGGIGLPGGAVYLQPQLLRSRGWRSAVSLAGPAMNLLFAIVLAIPFLLGVLSFDSHIDLASAVALLAFFQVAAVILNLLPIPPLDGYGVLEPYLSPQTAATMRSFGWYGLLLLFVLLWYVQPINELYFGVVNAVLGQLHIDEFLWRNGLSVLQFWNR